MFPDPNIICTDGDVRLRGGATPSMGRVEICLDNNWGGLCDNGWDANDAFVVCRQLGFRTEGKWTGSKQGDIYRKTLEES